MGAAVGLAGGIAPGAIGRGAPISLRGSRRAGGSAKNVIFMVSDGMSTGTLTLADTVKRRLSGKGTNWVGMWKREGVRRAMSATHSADSPVTDSAAGCSAWAVGVKVPNESLNVTEDGAEPEPLLVLARRAGKATGLVTTTRVTHATPAGFIANVRKRDYEGAVAEQMLARGVDVALGGGSRYFPQALLETHAGVRVVRTRDELLAPIAGDGPLLGVFMKEHMSFGFERGNAEPTLAEMTRAALSRLGKRDGGFVVQIEGGRVDHAAHANDAASLVREQLEFDEALGEVLAFMEGRDDTLLIVTTDHGNANPGLTLYGKKAARGIERLSEARHSFEWLEAQFAHKTLEEKREAAGGLVEEAMGIKLSEEELGILRGSLGAERRDPFLPACAPLMVLGSLLSNSNGVRFLSPNHTSDYVEVTATGPGSAAVNGYMDNTELFGVVMGAMGLVRT
jgi:alkaline phosphatase